VNDTVTQYTRSFNGVSLPTAWSKGRMTDHECTVSSPQIARQVTSRTHDLVSRYSKGLDTVQTALILQVPKWLSRYKK